MFIHASFESLDFLAFERFLDRLRLDATLFLVIISTSCVGKAAVALLALVLFWHCWFPGGLRLGFSAATRLGPSTASATSLTSLLGSNVWASKDMLTLGQVMFKAPDFCDAMLL